MNIRENEKVLHDQYGSGVVKRIKGEHRVLVEFDRRGKHFVSSHDIESFGKMLRDVEIDTGREWADEDPDDSPLPCGQVTVDLDFTDDVDFDVDVQRDGRIVVQYWRESDD